MLIDWFTVGAQALNFLILVWLMKCFLYKPILNAIDAREKLIAKELADAAAKKAEAEKERDEFEHKNEDFDKQRAALLSKATDDAKAQNARLLEEARTSAADLAAKRRESIQKEAQALNKAISRRTQQEVFAIARRALNDLAGANLEGQMTDAFIRRLRAIDGSAKSTLANALISSSDPAVVRSTFDLSPEQHAAIQTALNETFSADLHLRFETSPDLVSGIELTTSGQKIAWSIAEYLSALEKGVAELLDKKQPKAAPLPSPTPSPEPAA